MRTVGVVGAKMDFWQNGDIGELFWMVPEPSFSPAWRGEQLTML